MVDDSFRRSHTVFSLVLVLQQNLSGLVFCATVRYMYLCSYVNQSCEHSDILSYALLHSTHMTEDDISTMSELTYLAMKFQLQVVTSANCR